MTFLVGQKVVCVDARTPRYLDIVPVTKGVIYTIRDSGPEPSNSGEWWVLLNEITNIFHRRLGELGYDSCRFRPVVERKTDIGFAHEILRKASKQVDA